MDREPDVAPFRTWVSGSKVNLSRYSSRALQNNEYLQNGLLELLIRLHVSYSSRELGKVNVDSDGIRIPRDTISNCMALVKIHFNI